MTAKRFFYDDSYAAGARNNATRVAICLCVDTSTSMDGEPINELNRGIQTFVNELLNDEIAKYSAEIAVVEFNSNAEIKLPFTPVSELKSMKSELVADGLTAMGAGVRMAISLLNDRKAYYKQKGIPYYQPWLVLMSDGGPNDEYVSAANQAHQLSKNKQLLSIPIGIGSSARLDVLAQFSATVPALEIKNNDFKTFFKWLSASVVNQSRSNKDADFQFDQKQLGWLKQTS